MAPAAGRLCLTTQHEGIHVGHAGTVGAGGRAETREVRGSDVISSRWSSVAGEGRGPPPQRPTPPTRRTKRSMPRRRAGPAARVRRRCEAQAHRPGIAGRRSRRSRLPAPGGAPGADRGRATGHALGQLGVDRRPSRCSSARRRSVRSRATGDIFSVHADFPAGLLRSKSIVAQESMNRARGSLTLAGGGRPPRSGASPWKPLAASNTSSPTRLCAGLHHGGGGAALGQLFGPREHAVWRAVRAPARGPEGPRRREFPGEPGVSA